MAKRYKPRYQSQRDGSVNQWVNCWVKCTSMLVDAASHGRKRPSTRKVRAKAVKPTMATGGIADAVRVLQKMSLVRRLRYIDDMPKAELRQRLLARTGKVIMLETDFEHWIDAGERGVFYHSIVVICGEGKGKQQGRVLVGDPYERDKKYKWRPVSAVISAAMEYAREHGDKRGTCDVLIVTPPNN